METINNYARLISMKNTATKTRNDLVQLSNNVELVLPSLTMTNETCRGLTYESDGGGNADPSLTDKSFSFNPYCCINRTQQDIPFSKTGAVRINMILARINDFLHGQNLPNFATSTYEIRNLRLRFKTVPTQNENDPILLNVVYNIKNSVNSQFININANGKLRF